MIDLLHNLALLVAASAICGVVGRFVANRTGARLLHGLVFGAAAVIGMLAPLSFPDGIQVDGRSIVISVCGLFFGPAAAGVAGAMAAVCRLMLGGDGAVVGVLVIAVSGAIGVVCHYWWRDKPGRFSVFRVWGMGLAVHAAMLALIGTLPDGAGPRVVSAVGLPVIVFFPLVTVLIASILSDQRAHRHFVHRLEESEALLRIAGKAARVGGWIMELPERRVICSEEVYDIREWPQGHQPTLTDTLEACPPEWRASLSNAIEACIAEGVPYDLEVEIFTGRGRRIWVRAIGEAVRDGGGHIIRIQGAMQDITALKRIEQTLAQSNERFRQLADAMPLIVWTADPDGAIDYTSRALVNYTGLTTERALGDQWESLLHPEDLAPPHTVWAESVQRGDSYAHEARIRRSDGVYRWNQIQAVPVRNENGAIVKWYGTATDIHNTKLNEEATARMAERLTTTLESITDAFYTLDRDWRFSYLNGEAERLLRCDREDVLGKAALEVFPDLDGSEIAARFLEAARENRTVELETYYAPLECWFEARIYPSGEGLAVYFRDISDQKEAERERARLEEELRQAQKLEAVGRLAGGVAHDFNNMLGVILGYTDMAIHQCDDQPALKADLEQVQLAASRSAELTGQLLAFARKQAIAPKLLDLNETVDRSLKMLGRLIGEHIAIEWRPGAHAGPVKMDPTQIDQILANLAVNARDALDGHGAFTIETGSADFDDEFCRQNPGLAPGAYTQLSVSDDGCGMDEATRGQIFEPFFTTKPQGQGTGLGLATVYGIVRQNGGLITVASAPGEGTRFDIYLPRHDGAVTGEGAGARGEDAPRGAETLLLVEDEPALLALGERQLRRLGYNVLAASSPVVALELARVHNGSIDLLVTDVIMPEMNGRELWQRLDAIQPGIKTLFMSGYTADAIAQHGILDEGVHFLEKPFNKEEIAAKVREVLEGNGGQA